MLPGLSSSTFFVDELASRGKLLRFSTHQFAKVLSSSAIDIDFSLSPEPTKYADIGFLQRAFGSYQPDETYSPVVYKDTLGMFLSLCAAEDLEVYYCKVPSQGVHLSARPSGLFPQDGGLRGGDS